MSYEKFKPGKANWGISKENLIRGKKESTVLDVRYYKDLGAAFSKKKKWGKAIDAYFRAVEISSDEVWVYKKIAECYLSAHQEDDGLKWLAYVSKRYQERGETRKSLSILLQICRFRPTSKLWEEIKEMRQMVG